MTACCWPLSATGLLFSLPATGTQVSGPALFLVKFTAESYVAIQDTADQLVTFSSQPFPWKVCHWPVRAVLSILVRHVHSVSWGGPWSWPPKANWEGSNASEPKLVYPSLLRISFSIKDATHRAVYKSCAVNQGLPCSLVCCALENLLNLRTVFLFPVPVLVTGEGPSLVNSGHHSLLLRDGCRWAFDAQENFFDVPPVCSCWQWRLFKILFVLINKQIFEGREKQRGNNVCESLR